MTLTEPWLQEIAGETSSTISGQGASSEILRERAGYSLATPGIANPMAFN